jgi:peptidoglycan/xylan/chitin deacetylase (PgdA/CDA1 family)
VKLKLPGLQGARSRLRRLQRRVTPSALVLNYHRVAELPGDPYGLCVRPQRFAEQLQALCDHARPMRLQDLTAALARGRVPRRAVAVTFDDGYADNLHNARPLLERHAVPATMFITTGAVEADREFWWDELEQLLLQAGSLPETLEWQVNGTPNRFELAGAAVYTEAEQQAHRNWNLARQDNPSRRHEIFRTLYYQLRPLPLADKQQALNQLAGRIGRKPSVRATHRGLSRDEVIRLAEGGLVEIGAHTVSHTPLTTLPAAAQRREIEGSKEFLEELLGHAVTSFAYPHGLFAPETAAIARDSGFRCACATRPGAVRRGADPFALPRMLVQDWNGQELAERLETWFGA